MRRKIHFLLIPVYVVTFIIILYINGVFTGEPGSVSNLVINVGFLVVMGILLMMSVKNFSVLLKCVKELDEQTEYFLKEQGTEDKSIRERYINKTSTFTNHDVNNAFLSYAKSMNKFKKREGYTDACTLSDYINEDLLDHISKSHFNSNLPGTLTGLGILGTFLGLSIGLTSFNGDNLLAVSDNMGILIEGMKVAFHTSVYGIFFSLIFSFIYKSIMEEAYSRLNLFLIEYDNFIMPAYRNEYSDESASIIYQAQMANAMVEILALLKAEHGQQIAGVERIVSSVRESLLQVMGHDLEKMGNILRDAAESQTIASDCVHQMRNISEKLMLANSELLDKMKGLQDGQKKISRELLEQKETLEETCIELTKQVGSQLYAFNKMRDNYEN